jgi:AraC-like DNA-binding protein
MPESDVRLTTQLPCAQLRPYIKEFLVTESSAERWHVLLPETNLVAAFRFNGMIQHGASSMPSAVVSGLQHRARTLRHSGDSRVLLIRFTETGAAAFLREPLDLFFNETMPLEAVVRRSRLDCIEERLAEVKQHSRRFAILERLLIRQLGGHEPDRLVASVAARIKARNGIVRVEELARRVGLSQSALERRFRRVVGSSPKRFASIIRLRHVMRLRAEGCSLTEIAHRVGYCDQSHLIKDFRGFTGLPPELFFQTSSFC